MLQIIVINNYGQFCHLIHRAVRDLDQDSELMKNTSTLDDLNAKDPDGVILSGGPSMDRIGNCLDFVKQLDVPILGICLGHQLIAKAYGGRVETGELGGYASVEVEIIEEDDILKGMGPKINVWASHADKVSVLPEEFRLLAKSRICGIEAMKHRSRPIYGVQWHPEVAHTEKGKELLLNFFNVCRR